MYSGSYYKKDYTASFTVEPSGTIVADVDDKEDIISFILSTNDFNDFTSLILKLKYSQEPTSQYLYEHLSTGTQELIRDYDSQDQPSKEFQMALKTELNEILKSDDFYDEKRFENINLSKDVLELIKDNPQGQDLIELNRKLLEEAYPQEIEKSEYKVKESKRIPGFMGFSLIISILFIWSRRKFA